MYLSGTAFNRDIENIRPQTITYSTRSTYLNTIIIIQWIDIVNLVKH